MTRSAYGMEDFVRCFTALDELLVAKATADLFSQGTAKKGPAAYKMQAGVQRATSLSRSLTAN